MGGGWMMMPLAAAVGLFALELGNAGMVGPRLYGWMQESAGGTRTPQLLPVVGVFAMLSLATLLLLAVAAGLHAPSGLGSRLVQLAGSSTLGTYVLHMYFTFPLTLLQHAFVAIPGPECKETFCPYALTIQMALTLLAPIAFQLTLGLAFHKLLMLQYRLAFRLAAAIAAKTSTICSRPAQARDSRKKIDATAAPHDSQPDVSGQSTSFCISRVAAAADSSAERAVELAQETRSEAPETASISAPSTSHSTASVRPGNSGGASSRSWGHPLSSKELTARVELHSPSGVQLVREDVANPSIATQRRSAAWV